MRLVLKIAVLVIAISSAILTSATVIRYFWNRAAFHIVDEAVCLRASAVRNKAKSAEVAILLLARYSNLNALSFYQDVFEKPSMQSASIERHMTRDRFCSIIKIGDKITRLTKELDADGMDGACIVGDATENWLNGGEEPAFLAGCVSRGKYLGRITVDGIACDSFVDDLLTDSSLEHIICVDSTGFVRAWISFSPALWTKAVRLRRYYGFSTGPIAASIWGKKEIAK